MQLAYPAVDDQFASFVEFTAGSLLRTGLKDPAVTFSLVGKHATFGDSQSQRFFAVYVFARSNGGD